MRTRKPFIISAIAAAVAITSPLTSEVAVADGTAQKKSASAKKPSAVDERAVGALRKMGAFLRDQQSFTVAMTTDTDYVTDDGQKLTVTAQGKIEVRRPNKLRAEIISDRKERQFFYDGNTFTIYSPKLGFYSMVTAPPTILRLADFLHTRFGLELPMVDLFRWGAPGADVSEIELARYVGPAKIHGVATEHYAFRQRGVDWQIWIEEGAKPVPHKLILTTTDSKARPEYAVDMKWSLDAMHSDEKFSFRAPKNSTSIALAELGPRPELEDTRSARRAPRRER